MKLSELGDFGSSPTAKLTAERRDFQMSAMLILQFLTETLQVRTGVNTLVDTNQDKKSPGTHLGLTLCLSSALRVPICSFPASKRESSQNHGQLKRRPHPQCV